MAHAQRAASRFARHGKGRHERGLERALQTLLVIRIVALEALDARLHFGLECRSLRRKLSVGELLHLRFKRVDRFDQWLQCFHVALMFGPNETRYDAIYD